MKTKTMKIESFFFLVFVLSILFSATSYFQWESYGKPVIAMLLRYFRYGGLLIMGIYILTMRSKNCAIKNKGIIICGFLIVTLFEMNIMGATYKRLYNIHAIIAFFTFIICYAIPKEDRGTLYEFFMKTFAILVLPSLLYYIATRLFGIRLSFQYLASDNSFKVDRGIGYEMRPLGLIIVGIKEEYILPRICGIFDEPGVIGTITGFLSAINLLCRKNRKWTILIIIEGFFTFSMAFYLLLIITEIIILLNRGAIKVAIAMVVAMIAFNYFINADFDNEVLKSIQSRIDTSSGFLISDNRSGDSFNRMYEKFFHEDAYTILMGHGYDASFNNPETDGASIYKRIIYDYEILGACLYFGFFILVYLLEYGINKYNLPFFIVFVVSWYQRPYVMDELHITLYISGLAYIACNMNERMYTKNKKKPVQFGGSEIWDMI